MYADQENRKGKKVPKKIVERDVVVGCIIITCSSSLLFFSLLLTSIDVHDRLISVITRSVSHSVPVLEFLRSLGVDVSVVLLTSSHVLRVVALKGLDVENVAEGTSVRSGHAFDAHIELPAVGRVSVTRVVAWLLDL